MFILSKKGGKKKVLGIIRVLTTENENILQEHGKVLQEVYSIDSVSDCIPGQPNGIYDSESEATAIPKIIELAKEMENERQVDAITISCAADPALKETRMQVNVPVLGAGICGAQAAGMVGDKVGIIGITDSPPEQMKGELGNRFYSYSYSPSHRKTTDLFKDDAKSELLKVARRVVENGADVILFACTGFSTINLKEYLNRHIDIPVIDLVEAQGIAYQLVKGGNDNEK
jgi:Asp/Glu/hydantoin racemase